MGDKVKGKGSGNGKKAAKPQQDGNRPHEQRQREALANEAPASRRPGK